jgi:hypothetical protein
MKSRKKSEMTIHEKIAEIQRLTKELQDEAVSELFNRHDEHLPARHTQPYEVAQSNIIGCCHSILRATGDIQEIMKKCKKPSQSIVRKA